MKTKLFFLAAFLFSITAQAQEISSTHAFAIGSPEGVTIQWNAFGDEALTGCTIYKRLTETSAPQLITPEVLVSPDSLFSFIDDGEFDPISPPLYEIHAVTNAGSSQINECYGFKSINFEVLDANRIRFSLAPWNQDTCCSLVKVFLNDIFTTETEYTDSYQTILDLSLLSPGDVFKFTLINEAGIYESAEITYSYLKHLSTTLGLNSKELPVIMAQNVPNPFSTETTIRFDLKEKSNVSLDVISMDGLLIKTLLNQSLDKGIHEVIFNKGNLQRGVYIYRLTTKSGVSLKQMVIQ